MATLALQHHWLLPINCHFDDCIARLVRFRSCKQGRRQELTEGDVLTFLPSPSLPFSTSSLPFPSPPFSLASLPLSFHSPIPYPSPTSSLTLIPSFPVPFSPLSLEVGPLNQLGSLGERCNLPQRDPGQSPGRNRIWCTLELLESHW